MQRYSLEAWQTDQKAYETSKQVNEELSKLYLILSAKVGQALKNFALSPVGNLEGIKTNITNISQVLQRLSFNGSDPYLAQIDTKSLNRFRQGLESLLDQLHALLKIQESRGIVGATEQGRIPINRMRKGVSLQKELKKSRERLMSAKSRRVSQQPLTLALQNGSTELKKETISDKKRQIEAATESMTARVQNNLYFDKKYTGDNLTKYLQLKRQLSELQQQQKKDSGLALKQRSTQIPKEKDQLSRMISNSETKLFPQFNIKTKLMKETVKQNILNTVWEAKKQLLAYYHSVNKSKLREPVNDLAASPVTAKKYEQHSKPMQKQYSSPILGNTEPKRHTSISSPPKRICKNYSPMNPLRAVSWSQQDIDKQYDFASKKISAAKVPNSE